MISFQAAYKLLIEKAHAWLTHHQLVDELPLDQALDHILATDYYSDIPFPPFNKSLVDGYACRREDIGHELTLIGQIMAGAPLQTVVHRNECIKIMTGGVMPEGADIVLMREKTTETADQKILYQGPSNPPDNWLAQGREFPLGAQMLTKGTRLGPPHIGLLASIGVTSPQVFRRPRVGLFMTGDEIVPPSQTPKWGQMRNSNGPQLKAQLQQMGIAVTDWGIVPDNRELLINTIREASKQSDIIMTTGGVSMGDLDLLPELIQQEGWQILINRIKVKPGKPTTFAVHQEGPFYIGLPGNPVASFVIFEILIRPFIYQLMGHCYSPPNLTATLKQDVRGKESEREEFIPVIADKDGTIVPIQYHGSSHLQALNRATGLISLSPGVEIIKAGSIINVRSL